MISISINMDEWKDALRAISGPGEETVAELEAIMDTAFAETQAIVHVITGSLKGSGRTHFETKESEWSGDISYGGDSPGFPHDPVTYAGAEMGKGGSHDFLRNVDLIHEDLKNAMYTSMDIRMRE